MISKLKQSRIHLNLTVEEVANKLKIRKQYIVAIEENRLDEVPGEAYINGYIKMYCNFLKIPCSEYSTLEQNLEEIYIEPIFSNSKSRHRVGIAVFLMTILCVLSWYYLTNEVQARSTIIEHLENLDPKSYLSNSSDGYNAAEKTQLEE